MIHAIVYANRNGYGFFEQTEDFPLQYINQIQNVCGKINDGKDSSKDEYAIRYAPLKDRFLLSAIRRYPNGNDDQSRAHKIVVNFLLESQDAERIWSCSVSQCAEAAMRASEEILKKYRDKRIASDIFEKYLKRAEGEEKITVEKTTLQLLLGGLFSCGMGELRDQLFIQTKLNQEKLLDCAMEKIPERIRKYARFITNIHSEEETVDVSLCCYKPQGLYSNVGGPATNKSRRDIDSDTMLTEPLPLIQYNLGEKILKVSDMPLYSFFSKCVCSWEDFDFLIKAASKENSVKNVLSGLDKSIIVSNINKDLSLSELLELNSAVTEKNELFEAIMRAAEKKCFEEYRKDTLSYERAESYAAILPDYFCVTSVLNPASDEKNEINEKSEKFFEKFDSSAKCKEHLESKEEKPHIGIKKESIAVWSNIICLILAVALLVLVILKAFRFSAAEFTVKVSLLDVKSIIAIALFCIISFIIGFLARNLPIMFSRVKREEKKKFEDISSRCK